MKQVKPIIHGRDHAPGGADPVLFALEWEDVGLTCSGLYASYSEAILLEPFLVAYWPLNEASGDALDASGNGHDLPAASFSGPPTQGSSGPFPGDTAQTAYTFGGYLQSLDSALDLGSDTAVTFECWAYPTSAPALTSFVAQCAGASFSSISYALQMRSGRNVFWQVGAQQLDSVVALTLSTWTHIVGTSSVADGSRLYFNGAQVATGTGSAPANVTVLFRIGQGETVTAPYPFTGRIAQVALYNAVLPAATIIQHYNQGVAP